MSRAYRVGWTGHAPGNRELCVTAKARTQLRDVEEPALAGSGPSCVLLFGETRGERCEVSSLMFWPAGPMAEREDALRKALESALLGHLVGFGMVVPDFVPCTAPLLKALGEGWTASNLPPCEPAVVLLLHKGEMEAYWLSTRVPTQGQYEQYLPLRSPSKGNAPFHHTNFGMYGEKFWVCLDGFVATSIREVRKLRWPDGKPSAERAAEIAAWNRTELKRAQSRMNEWPQ